MRLSLLAAPLIFVLHMGLLSTQSLLAATIEHPNVLLILTDDQGYGDISSHGNPVVSTPVQDALAESGARFERFFVSPVCAPTRASLLTGRYHLRTGVNGVTRGHENLRADEVTIAEILKSAGYATGCFGKWHNGRHMPMHPNGQGFDTFLGFCGGHWNTYFDPPLEENGHPIQREGYIADIFTAEAMDFISAHAEHPWFCYVAYNTPHSPWRVPDRFWNKYNGLGLDTKAQCAYAMVENIDENVGKLLERLQQQDEERETIVLFLTDNGANSPRFNAGMKGRKGSVDEGGTRVPLFIRYPQKIAPRTVVRPIAFHLDLLPTLAEFCNVTLDHAVQESLDGRSLVPLLTNSNAADDWPKRMLFTETYRSEKGRDFMKAAVRTDQWRTTFSGGTWKLYDMIADPGQEMDVSKKHPEVVRQLSTAFEDWFGSLDIESVSDSTIPVGHSARTVYTLPANEATLVPGYGEEIKYTGDTPNGFANAWITDWRSVDAYPEWQLKVLNSGLYDVALTYTCRAEDVGCQLAVEFGDQRKLVNVPHAHDPPLVLKPDHIYSSNYQDKASWARLPAGRFQVPEGDLIFRIRLTEIAREQGIDLKEIIPKRISE